MALLIGAAWTLREDGAPAPDPGVGPALRIEAGDVRFGPGLRRPLRVLDASSGAPLAEGFHCRWVPAHADIGFTSTSADGCSAEFHVDPRRTRVVRFELDPWMSVDVIVTRGSQRVGVASIALRFVE